MLLVHHIAADDTSVLIHDQRTFPTLTDRDDRTLGHTMRVVCITEFEKQLLLLVVAHHTLIGNGSPEILVVIDKYHTGNRLDTHPRECLFHITLKTLCLMVIDAIA